MTIQEALKAYLSAKQEIDKANSNFDDIKKSISDVLKEDEDHRINHLNVVVVDGQAYLVSIDWDLLEFKSVKKVNFLE